MVDHDMLNIDSIISRLLEGRCCFACARPFALDFPLLFRVPFGHHLAEFAGPGPVRIVVRIAVDAAILFRRLLAVAVCQTNRKLFFSPPPRSQFADPDLAKMYN